VRVKHQAKMHHGQNRGSKKSKLSKKSQLNENRGKFRNFSEIGGTFINFVEIGSKMHHWLRGMDAPGHAQRLDSITISQEAGKLQPGKSS